MPGRVWVELLKHVPDPENGGLALSLWMTGANETDCILAARLSKRGERLDDLYYGARTQTEAVLTAIEQAVPQRLRRAASVAGPPSRHG